MTSTPQHGGTVAQPTSMEEGRQLLVVVEPEYQLLSGGLQPFMFQSATGTLVVQAQVPYPVGYAFPAKNVFPGLPETVVSRDGGHTWALWPGGTWKREPLPPEQGQGPIIEGAVVQLSDGTIRIFDWIAEGPTAEGDFIGTLWDSHDEWRTLQGPRPFRVHLPQAKASFDDQDAPYSGPTFHRSVLELPGGDLLATIYCWFKEDNIPIGYLPRTNRLRSVILRSGDRGETWHYLSTIAVDPPVGYEEGHEKEGFGEAVMVRLSQGPHAGRLICVMRTGWGTEPLYQTHSDDDGHTWAPPHALPLKGIDPDLIEMENGVLACSFGYRIMTTHPGPGTAKMTPAPDLGNYVAFSLDQGETWGHDTHLPIEAHAGTTCSTCYTSLREVEPGTLLVIFDIGWYGDPIRYVGRRFVRVRRA